MELTDYVRILRKNWVMIVLITILSTAGAITYSLLQTPQYSSTTEVFVSTQIGESSSELAQGNTYTLSRVRTYAQLTTTEEVLSGVVDELQLDMSATQLAERVTATPFQDTTILEIRAISPDREEAAAIANSTAASLAVVVDEVESVGGGPSPVRLTAVQSAQPPASAFTPRTTLNLVLGAALGLLVALGSSVLREVLDTRIRSHRDLERASPHPILATIAYDPKAKQRPLVVRKDPGSPPAEAYRALRTNLQFVQVDGGDRTFVVTSSVPGEGKSTTSANLAIALADTNQTVLVIDADLRRPRLDRYLGVEGSVGLTDVLIGRARLTDAVQLWGNSGLYVLPAGRTPPNPSELLDSKAMTALLSELRPQFDWIIIDASPLLPVTDAVVLARKASGVMVAVAAGKTTENQFQAALDALRTVDAAVLGVILTMAPTRGADGYGYGYGYGADEQQRPAMPRSSHGNSTSRVAHARSKRKARVK